VSTAGTLGSDQGVPRIVIVGGGYTGAVVALNLARQCTRPVSVTVIEPRPWLGGGLAYSTHDPAHRINVPSTRMSVISDDELHFDRWIKEHGAVAGDADAALPDGRIFPRRLVFGTYVRSELAAALDGSLVRFAHVQSHATGAERLNDIWRVRTSDGGSVEADMLVLAATHPPPAPPAAITPLLPSEAVIVDPWQPDALKGIGMHDSILIVGTALSMADIVASLQARGHEGQILAVSRRGLLSREHVWANREFGDFATAPSVTALALTRQIRKTIVLAKAESQPWQVVLDAVRRDAPAIWAALPQDERARLVRHARSFWDVHRFRVAPQVGAVITKRQAAGTLEVLSASMQAARKTNSGIDVELRLRGRGRGRRRDIQVDRIIIATGPGHGGIFRTNTLLAELRDAGHLQQDALDLGLLVDDEGVPISASGHHAPNIWVAGPLARGTVGELMGLPQVTKHAERIAHLILATREFCKRAA
jgi:uncharacterized NAD(P)/FAD-binding protein YdhS